MIQDLVHQKIVQKHNQVTEWFEEKRKNLAFPVYASFDIRDANFKAAVIDANIFPAGFNNICEVDRENAPDLMEAYLNSHYGEGAQRVALITEEHTNNAFYWENVNALKNIIEGAGRELRLAMPKELPDDFVVESALGHELQVGTARREGSQIFVGDFSPQLLLSNNDFSQAYEDWGKDLSLPINPPREMGWYQRKKGNYFDQYNQIILEFAELLEIDPWFLQVESQTFRNFDLAGEESLQELAQQVDALIQKTKEKYQEHSIEAEPFVVMKNNSGTYGLAVLLLQSGEDVLKLNYKSRKKMKASKGGGGVNEVILQEGIPSAVLQEGETAEPAIYMIGCELAGGFLRAHGKKGPKESLNSPGAVYRRLCVSDLKVNVAGHPLENVYGWLARLGSLAIGRESAKMGVKYLNYQ